MKKIVSLGLFLNLFFCIYAQDPLGICNNKTVTLVFPYDIIHVDRGTADVLTNQVNSAKNILLVKAAKVGFIATNLTVVTDGAIYSFNVHYNADLSNTVFWYPRKNIPVNRPATDSQSLNLQDQEGYSKMVVNKRTSIHGLKDTKWDAQGRVRGIFIKNDVLFFQVSIQNISTISYDCDLIRFFIQDKKKSKRTSSQEIDMKPIYTYGNAYHVESNRQKNMVFAFEKFTIPDAKVLYIQIMEKNGGRHILIKVKNNKIIKAKALPTFDLDGAHFPLK